MRFFLFDQVVEVEVGKKAHGVKCISITDETLFDHFPDYPIYPGSLITEGVAQLAGFLLEVTFNDSDEKPRRRAVLSLIEKMKFYQTSGPGDRLDYFVQIDSIIDNCAMVSIEVLCLGEKRAKGKLMFTLLEIASDKITQQRLEIYKIWTRTLTNCPALR